MANPTGESTGEILKLDFDRKLILQFRGAVVTSDAGLLAYRAMDQGRKRRDQKDAAVMPLVRRQRRPPSASCAGLQSRQFPAHASNAGADQRLVAGKPEGKADQDRRESREPRPLRCLSDGRSRDSENSLRRHLAADRGTAAAAGLVNSVRRSIVTRSNKNHKRPAS